MDPISLRFTYDGRSRLVDNVQFKNNCIVGYEMRRSGKFSQKIKSYRLDKITSTIERIELNRRNRPEVPTLHSILPERLSELVGASA